MDIPVARASGLNILISVGDLRIYLRDIPRAVYNILILLYHYWIAICSIMALVF